MNPLIENILKALEVNQISSYLITELMEETVELFFIKKNLDMRREKTVTKYKLTVYHDFTKEDVKMRGSSAIGIYNGMTQEEVNKAVKNAAFAASFVCNPYYELPKGVSEEHVIMESYLSGLTLTDAAAKFSEALFAEDSCADVFMNSAELFVEKIYRRTINSEGIDVSYEKYEINGEFVAQCTQPQDVETYQSFHYDDLDTEALKHKVKHTLDTTKARALATTAPTSGEYTVLISGQYVKDIFHYYLERSSASLIYPNYSNFQIGKSVQGEDVTGDVISILLTAKEPYSEEGIAMTDRTLVTEGVLKTIHGNSRFSYYLNTPPTGSYNHIRVPSGSMSFEDMKTGKFLHIVNFSDFQMDTLSGHFGGEIRLAFLSDGNTITPVTGGSIHGSIIKAQKNLIFSKELQVEKGFDGPLAVKFENINVAGI